MWLHFNSQSQDLGTQKDMTCPFFAQPTPITPTQLKEIKAFAFWGLVFGLVVHAMLCYAMLWGTAQCSESPIFRNLNIPKNGPPGEILKYLKWHKTHSI